MNYHLCAQQEKQNWGAPPFNGAACTLLQWSRRFLHDPHILGKSLENVHLKAGDPIQPVQLQAWDSQLWAVRREGNATGLSLTHLQQGAGESEKQANRCAFRCKSDRTPGARRQQNMTFIKEWGRDYEPRSNGLLVHNTTGNEKQISQHSVYILAYAQPP